MSKIVKRIIEVREPDFPNKSIPVVECNCGELVTCSDGWANECDQCGTEYNGSGQELCAREFWGEETGEQF